MELKYKHVLFFGLACIGVGYLGGYSNRKIVTKTEEKIVEKQVFVEKQDHSSSKETSKSEKTEKTKETVHLPDGTVIVKEEDILAKVK